MSMTGLKRLYSLYAKVLLPYNPIMHSKIFFYCLISSLFFQGCRTVLPYPSNNVYVVKSGDNLWDISRKFNVPMTDIARANHLGDASILRAGQTLRIPGKKITSENKPTPRENKVPTHTLPPEYETPVSTNILFLMPLKGKILSYYDRNPDILLRHGILISSEPHAGVLSSAEGIVSYSDFMKGFGQVVMIQHSDNFITVYANLTDVRVSVGDRVRQGNLIAYLGKVFRQGSSSLLYLEFRHKGSAVNPLFYLKADDNE